MTPAEHYLQTFHIQPTLTNRDRQASYNIRYQVYCKEFGFEAPPDNHLQQETDEYDQQSLHCLLIHNQSQRPAGTVRLVISDRQQPLPFWKYCHQAIDTQLFDPQALRADQVVEFSRAAIIADFRRREKQSGGINDNVSTIHRERRYSDFPVIPVCLFIAALAMFADSQADFGVAMMEPKLHRLLRKVGINFQSIGRVIDYHGRRAPYIIRRDAVPDQLPDDVQALFAVIREQWQSGLLATAESSSDIQHQAKRP